MEPAVNDPRSGFPAVSTEHYLSLTGGEHINGVPQVISTSGVLVAGAQQFNELAAMKAPVHGHRATIYGNAFFAIGGSKTADISRNEGDVQILRR